MPAVPSSVIDPIWDHFTEKRSRVIDAFIALTNALITIRRLIHEPWTRYRWNTRPPRQP